MPEYMTKFMKPTKPFYTRFSLLIPGFLLLVVLLAGCGETTTSLVQPTPSPVQFSALSLGLPSKALDAPVTGKVPDSQVLHVGITFNSNQALVDQLGKNTSVQAGSSTGSSDVASLANSLGITDQTYAKIKSYFSVEDATLNLSKLHTNLTIDAKASTFARLMQTSFVFHTLNGRTYYTPDPNHMPQLPTFIASQIAAITGLDNYSLPPQAQASFTPAHTSGSSWHSMQHQSAADCNIDPSTLAPAQVAHAYGYDQFWNQGWYGQNMAVNLVEIDGFNAPDISNYFGCANFHGHLNVYTIDGKAPQPGSETTLDIDMLVGMAPALTINDYQTDISAANVDAWTRLNDALVKIIDNNTKNTHRVNIVSMSLGAPESNPTTANVQAIHKSIEYLTKVEHMTVLVATGDCAAFMSHVYNNLAVSFPASDPYAVGVGGTMLTVDAQGNRLAEQAWSDGSDPSNCHNQWGTGGGVSTLFTRPSWQNAAGLINRYSNGHRQLPDVSAVAYDLAVYYQGQWQNIGGTSAATPIWAAGMALVNQGLVVRKHVFFYGPTIFYAIANHNGSEHPYADITIGDNLYYSATQGWDYPTGLGTPNLVDFFLVLYRSLK